MAGIFLFSVFLVFFFLLDAKKKARLICPPLLRRFGRGGDGRKWPRDGALVGWPGTRGARFSVLIGWNAVPGAETALPRF